jgi:hypothetical protein
MNNKASSTDKVVGSVFKNDFHREGARGGGVFHFTCYDKDGNLKWQDSAKNIVVNTGLQDMNTKYFKGSSYTAAWYIGLVSDSGFVQYNATDTLASHSDWTETTAYSGGNRITAVFGTATTADPSVIGNDVASGGTVAVFSITGTVTVKGAFLTDIQDKTNNTGLLFSVSNFTGGDRSVVSGDTLNVTYEFSLADA